MNSRLSICPDSASKENGSVVSEACPRGDVNSSLSDVLNIEWHSGRVGFPLVLRLTPAEVRVPTSPLLCGPNRESGVAFPRNISTRMGVCRVGAVGLTSVSPRGMNWSYWCLIRVAAEAWNYVGEVADRRGIE